MECQQIIWRIKKIDNELTIVDNENLIIIDNGCDQTIINLNSFVVMTFTGILFDVNGAMASMKSEPLEFVNNAYTLATLNNKEKCILKLNQCLLDKDPHAFESLL